MGGKRAASDRTGDDARQIEHAKTRERSCSLRKRPRRRIAYSFDLYDRNGRDCSRLRMACPFVRRAHRRHHAAVPIGFRLESDGFPVFQCRFDRGARGRASLIEHRVGRVADRFVVPAREDLDETDQTEWATGPKGPEDPWTQQSYLPLENVETGDIVTFVSGSVGGRSAVSKLCARAAKHLAAIGQPRIKLAVESYRHKTFGRIDKPDFQIVGWSNSLQADAPAAPVTNPPEDFSDSIPF
jgi:hypothetical protein